MISDSTLSQEQIQEKIKGNWNIEDFISKQIGGRFDEAEVLRKVPSLNSVKSLEDLKALDGKLVRFTGFIQDMVDQDFFIGLIKKEENFSSAIPSKYHNLDDKILSEIPQESWERS